MSSREIWVGTSWKMNKTIGEARVYADRLATATLPPSVRLFVMPPLTALAAVRDRLGPHSRVLLGAQNAHWAPEGAGTGEVSMRMVQDAGATLVEIGHSERRAQFGETDETVARKARAALDQGLMPLICVGEPLDVRSEGLAEPFVRAQVRAALSLVRPDEMRRVLLAYEPVWAIGVGGRPATRAEVSPIMAAVAGDLAEVGGCRALLYGGGVDLDNARELLLEPHTRGLFVGRAAWSVGGLLALVQVAAALSGARRDPTSSERL